MIYERRLTVPKNTAQALPATATITVHPGVVRQVTVLFPRRCAQLVHVQIDRWSSQLWPPYADMDLTGDGESVTWEEEFYVTQAPYTFGIRAWSDDDTYGHVITTRISVLPLDATASGGVLKQFTDLFSKLLTGKL